MFKQKIAVATHSLDLPLKQALSAVASMGVSGVQFDVRQEIKPTTLSETGRRQLLQQLRDANLTVGATCFPLRSALYDPLRLEGRLEAIKSALLFTYQLNATVLTIPLGALPDPESAQYKLLSELLNDLARWGNHVGAFLAITTTGQNPKDLQALLSLVTEGIIGIDFDAAALVTAGFDPTESFRILHDKILHTQVRDIVRQSTHTSLEVPLGRGEIDWLEMLALHEEATLQNWLTLIRNEGSNKSSDLSNAAQYLDRLIQQR